MHSSQSQSKLPTWLFIVTDLALVGAAALIAYNARPLSNASMLLIVGCIGGGAILALVPLVLRYEQQKNEALDDRQRALESLARTVASSAEQISIAAGGLHEIAEIAQRNLKQAEQLPHKLQEKIAEFQAQLSSAEDADREEMERELLALRTTESERLESVSQRIAKSSAEWSKLEAATQQHLAAATEALAKLQLGTAAAIGKAQAAAEQALGQARVEAARVVGEAGGNATRALDTARTAAIAEFETKAAAAAERLTRALDTKLAQIEAAARAPGSVTPPPAEPSAAATAPEPPPSASAPAPVAPAVSDPEPLADVAVAPPKRPRKPRREEAPEPPAVVSTDSAPQPAPGPAPAPPVETPEPRPAPSASIPEVAPVAPHTAEPFAGLHTNGAAVETRAAPADAPPAAEAPKPPRKRAASKKPETSSEPGLGLDLDEAPLGAGPASAERVLSSDGATRLLVTAYIGIGNRLFIRGEGPGLSWEKGVPLQFVSIGKWRWETNDASAPIQFRIFKNDELECAALGAQTLDPGHQQELMAAFT